VLDAEDHDFVLGFIDPIQDAVGAAPRGMDACELSAQLFTDAMRVLD
jgi:hypothetical protein